MLLPLTVFCQDRCSTRLSISGELGISPAEEIWVDSHYTKQIGELWQQHNAHNSHPFNSSYKRFFFFAEDTLMFLKNKMSVGWSGNHGKTWESVNFGKSSQIDAAYINNNGKAWMSGSSQLIYYTEDSGQTWTSFDKVEQTGNLRFATIHFAKDEKTGLFGSFWNVLYRTKDNCQNWEKLPTPLDQNKYKNNYKYEQIKRRPAERQPEIREIRIFGNKYIINQQGKVFITNSEKIDWIYFPDIIDFEVTENEDLYVINTDYKIELYNAALEKKWQSEQKIDQFLRAIAVRNNKLFVLTTGHIYKFSPGETVFAPLLKPHIPEPNRYPATVFSNFDVTEIHFEYGRDKRYLRNNAQKIYIKKGNTFVVDEKTTIKKRYKHMGCISKASIKEWDKDMCGKETNSFKNHLLKSVKKIDSREIDSLIAMIDKLRYEKVTTADLNISDNDVKEFLKFIDKNEQRITELEKNNPYIVPDENKFNFYRAVADTLFKISDEDVNSAFWKTNDTRCGTEKWRRITFVLHDGKKLIVENTDYNPNYLYTPWVVNYEGLRFRTNSILLGQKIDKITNGQFFDSDARDKNQAIFDIVDYLYRKQLYENKPH